MKTGIILEGGAMRGLFSAGVIDVLMRHHITFDKAIGVSAGAVFGCNLKSHQIGRVIRYNVNFCKDPQLCGLLPLLTTGDIYGGKYCYTTLPSRLDIFDTDTFEKDPLEFWCVCTDTATGNPVYHKCSDGKEEDLQYLRASASMPGVSRPVKVGGMSLLDGGISDSIPLHWMMEQDVEKIVLILTQPLEYRKTPLSPKVMKALKAALFRYPAVVKRMEKRPDDYNAVAEEIQQLEKEGKIFVIRPPQSLNIAQVCHDAEEMKRVYRIGTLTGERRLNALKEYLEY